MLVKFIRPKLFAPVDDNNPNPVDGGNPTNNDNKPSDNSEDTVKYASFKKLLDEKKNLSSKHSDALAKLAEYEARDKEAAERKAIEEKKFTEVLQTKEQELNELRNTVGTMKKNEEDFRKVHSFLNGLGDSKLESKYYSLIPLDDIRMTDEGDIDQESLVDVITNFKTDHKRLLISQKPVIPNNKTGDSSGKKLSPSQWRALKSSKEMAARYKDVDFSLE